MCGLMGYISKDNKSLTREQKIVRGRILNGMSVAMETRGDHSTGVCGVIDGKTEIVKKMKKASDFINLKEYKEFIDKSPSIVLGHTRFATIGAICDKNAHPFEIGRIIGCHNGHVNNYKDHFAKAEVDSEAIFHLLNKKNNNYKKTFEKLSGNITATWIDNVHLDRVHLVAHQNPLCMVKVKELNTIFWLSEIEFLKSIIEASVGIKNRKFTDIYQDRENEVFTISDKLDVETEKVEFAYGFASSNYGFDDEDYAKTDSKTLKLIQAEKNASYIKFEDYFESKEERSEFVRIVGQRQCSYCQKKTPIENGFWYDLENLGLVCQLCVQEDGDTMGDTLQWVYYNEYFDLLKINYDTERGLVQ